MARGEIRIGDVGTVFELTIRDQDGNVVEIDQSTVRQIIFLKPGNVRVVRNAVFSTDGSDGRMRYTTVAGDLDVAGDWRYQGYIEMPGGIWRTDIHTFRVHDNL